MGKMNVYNDAMLTLFAEMILDEAIRKRKESHLYQQIDSALAEGMKLPF
ncbi:IDEAL domain-containing protein [Paenibacillus larvae]